VPAFKIIYFIQVKRNRALLPTTQHAAPLKGDWLKKRYIVNNYILLDTLGTGSYGEVRMCKDRTTDSLYAMKIISKDMLKKKKGGANSETYFEDIKREIAIMKKLLHPNVLRLYEVLDDPKVNKLYLLLEYMKDGDLVNVLKVREDKSGTTGAYVTLGDVELWNVFRQVAAGVRYLHFQNVVHGDIKPQNLLVEGQVVKIADFGISKMLNVSGQKVVDAAGITLWPFFLPLSSF
jgi:serine/threonine protein kinase